MDTTIAPSYYPSEQGLEPTTMDTTVGADVWDPSMGFLMSPDTDDFAVDWSSSSPEISPVAYSPTFADYFGVQDADYFAAPLVQPIKDDWAASKGIKHSASDDEYDDDLYAIPSPPPAKKQHSSKSSSPRGAAQEKPSAKSNRPKHSLRTTARASKAAATASAESSPSESSLYIPEDSPQAQATTEHHRARHNHNLIEKQYRNRLNSQFEQLLAALPEEGCILGEGKAIAGRLGADDRRISKAGVLDKARRHIVALEAETKKLRTERKALIENVQLMQQTILAQGGRGYGM